MYKCFVSRFSLLRHHSAIALAGAYFRSRLQASIKLAIAIKAGSSITQSVFSSCSRLREHALKKEQPGGFVNTMAEADWRSGSARLSVSIADRKPGGPVVGVLFFLWFPLPWESHSRRPLRSSQFSWSFQSLLLRLEAINTIPCSL